MADDMEGRQYAKGSEGVVTALKREFLEEAEDRIRALDVALYSARQERKPVAEVVVESHRLALTLRGQADGLGLKLVGTVAYRMEDYLANVRSDLGSHGLEDLQCYVDRLLELVTGRIPGDADLAEVVRQLPAKYTTFDIGDIEIRNIEVLLVMLHSTQSHYVERELQQCGYRVSIVTNTFDAIPLVVRTKPDLIIVSAMMPELGGIDLVAALSAMPSTRNIPTALITSLSPDDEKLKLLPSHVPVILKGPSFGDDLFKTLDRLFLI
ncbi:MAG: response regulator [Alphaproteobacteria bacterium]